MVLSGVWSIDNVNAVQNDHAKGEIASRDYQIVMAG